MSHSVSRRKLLGAAGAAGVAGLAGCLGGGGGDDGNAPELAPPVKGNPDAAVVVKVYEDFACSHCATYTEEVLPKLESEYLEPGRIRYEHRDFPIPVDQRWSWSTAIAARSVQDTEGDDAFWEFAKEAYRRQAGMSMSAIKEIAGQVGADPARVTEDTRNEAYRSVVEADRKNGVDAGVGGTPTVFVDGETITSNYIAIAGAIDAALD